MILSAFDTKVQARLVDEAGSAEWWTSAEIKQYANDLYRETARETRSIIKRDTSTVSIASTAKYIIPKGSTVDTVLYMRDVTYDKMPVDAYTIRALNRDIYNWRDLSGSDPWGWYYEPGEENLYISFVPTPSTAADEIGMEFAYVPVELADGDSFAGVFTDGLIMLDGVMAMCLSKSGGGRDLDRADFYWAQFVGKVGTLSRENTPIVHSFRSVEESQASARRGVRMPSNYPTYFFE